MKELPIELLFVESTIDTHDLGVDLADVLVRSNLAKTKSEARRSIVGGAVRINDFVVEDPFARLLMMEEKFFIVQKDPV
jgi:tyrosyl-tRNA synthetase